MRHLQNLPLFACLFLLALIPLSAKAFPPPSPAGGNYLVLDGVDDYAVLDFETFGVLLPKGTDEFTFEAWIYLTTLPNHNILAMILSQQVRMHVLHVWQGDLRLMGGAHVDFGVVNATISFGRIQFSPNQWYHIAFQGEKGRTIVIVNDFARILRQGFTLAHDISHVGHPQDFTLGGFGEEMELQGGQFWGHFEGYIDEVRISNVARYDVVKGGFTPRRKFAIDTKTVALWHFDESRGTREFSDTSSNAYHLVGKNGAETGGALAVEAEGKLAITWGRLKQ